MLVLCEKYLNKMIKFSIQKLYLIYISLAWKTVNIIRNKFTILNQLYISIIQHRIRLDKKTR